MRMIRLLAATLAAALIAAPAAAVVPAPELVSASPADEAEIEAPLGEIALTFAAEVDLLEVALVTPDERRVMLHDVFNGDEVIKGDSFILPLPEAESLPGAYRVEIAASVSDPADGSASSLGVHNSFTIAEPPPVEDPSASAEASPATPQTPL